MSKYYIPSGRCIQQMDYSHRNPDGSVGAIPDSLTSVFYTAKGRPVRDGGGIMPDIKIEEPEQPTLMFYLMTDFIVTDFVAEWSQKHKKIAPPETFVVTDEDFEAFKQYAKAKNFTYDRQSEKILKNLKEVAKIEGFLEQDSTLFDALSAKLIPDLERDFDRNKERIKEVLASEIMKRYYYQKGDLIQSLRDDKVLEKALEVLNDPALYEKTLSAPVGI
jgi:carboxyl-terminal processing protease